MDDFHRIELLVAFLAEFPDIADRLELVLADPLVADSALFRCDGPVDEFAFPHVGVAFSSNTGLFCFCCAILLGVGMTVAGNSGLLKKDK